MTFETLMSIDKDDLEEAAKTINRDDLPQLVEYLSEKDDKIRYQAFLLLSHRSSFSDDVYPFWDTFISKLNSNNSYQRSIGLMLIAENAKWDFEHKLDDSIDAYLALLNDEKPITIRQCIQSLGKIVPYTPNLNDKIVDKLISLDLTAMRETMRKLILLDLLNILVSIRNTQNTEAIEGFILTALSGELLDKKGKKQIEQML